MRLLSFLLLGLLLAGIGQIGASKTRLLDLDTLNSDSKRKNPGWGEGCRKVCAPSPGVTCKNLTCVCDSSYPVFSKEKKECLKALIVGQVCATDGQCQHHDKNTKCQHYSSDFTECICRDSFELKSMHGTKKSKICYPDESQRDKDLPTFLGLGFVLSVMSALICLVLRMFANERFARPRRYANAAIPPPLTVSETYAAFALAAANSNRSTPVGARPRIIRSASSSRRPSYVSLNQHRAGELLRLASSSSLGHHRFGSRRPSVSSVRSYRSQSGLIPDLRPEPDHYILYMIRGPSQSVASDATSSTTCDSTSPRTPKSTEQILAVYHPVPEHSILDLGKMGPSHTSSTFRTLSSEDVFQEEEEDFEDEEEKEEDTESKDNTNETEEESKPSENDPSPNRI